MPNISDLKGALKRALRLAGIAVFGTFGVVDWLRGPRWRPEPADIRRVLVIRLDLMGDVVFSIPAIEVLGEAFPLAAIDVLVLPYTSGLLAGHPSLHFIYQLDVNRYRRPAGLARAGR